MSAAPELEALNLSKQFGALRALDSVSLKVAPGEVHALLGENGAGKSTLVKCVMGYYRADSGSILVDGREVDIKNPKQAQDLGLGMVYQHFTLVENMTVAENLVLARSHLPRVIRWRDEHAALRQFLDSVPFRPKLEARVRDLAAGEKQKVEILKQLYLKSRFLILDEPTSVLTPQEADEMLGLIRAMTRDASLSVLIITHKFREVERFADAVTVLRRGRRAGHGSAQALARAELARLMIGAETGADTAAKNVLSAMPEAAPSDTAPQRDTPAAAREIALFVDGLVVNNETGQRAVDGLSLQLHRGEILGVAGVAGNGQRHLVEALAGQRTPAAGTITVGATRFRGRRSEMQRERFYALPEEPLRNASVAAMTVAQNLLLRSFDRAPYARNGFLLSRRAMRARARELIRHYRIRTPSPEAPLAVLSGGNVQRSVLARELSNDARVLVVANPCFGLDFSATAEIRAQLKRAREQGVAVLLLSEDLDEILELADRVVVMSGGKFNYESAIGAVNLEQLGSSMAGHA